jgi:hypothetical protein
MTHFALSIAWDTASDGSTEPVAFIETADEAESPNRYISWNLPGWSEDDALDLLEGLSDKGVISDLLREIDAMPQDQGGLPSSERWAECVKIVEMDIERWQK